MHMYIYMYSYACRCRYSVTFARQLSFAALCACPERPLSGLAKLCRRLDPRERERERELMFTEVVGRGV